MSRAKGALRTFILMLMAFAPAMHAQAVVNGSPAPCNDRRFDCVGLFFTAGTIPGSCGGAVSGSCVLIAPDRILLKRHSLNIVPGQPISAIGTMKFRARFRRNPSGDAHNYFYFNGTGDPCHGVYQEALITSFVDPPNQGSDTIVGYLDKPIVNIRPAPIDVNTMVKSNTPVVLAGWGYEGQCIGSGGHWSLNYSRGMLPWDMTNDSFWYTACSIGTTAPCLSCPAGGPWVVANLHDSGAAVFIETPSGIPGDNVPELRLIGTVGTTTTANRPVSFNRMGGLPALQQTPPLSQGAVSDFNRDLQINTGDVFNFLSAYFANACISDVSKNGTTSVADIFEFVQAFFAKR